MVKAKLIAKILSLITWLLAFGFLAILIYSFVCLATKWNVTPYGDGKFLHINYPFTQKPFLNIDDNANYIFFSFLLPLSLYGIFFWFVANVFFVFSKPKLFTTENLVQLKRFYLFNWISPPLAVLLGSFFVEVESGIWLLVVVHIVLGIFAWFIAIIFRQGLQLQNDQDLFI